MPLQGTSSPDPWSNLQMTRRTLSTLLAAALTATLGAACTAGAPAAVTRPGTARPTAADALPGVIGATLTPIAPGQPLAVPAGDGAVLALTAGKLAAGGRIALSEAPSAEPPSGEAALRAWERRFAGIVPGPRYRLQAEPPLGIGEEREFWVIARADQAGVVERQVSARAVYVGTRCEVVVDARLASRLDGLAGEMGRAFDDAIQPTDAKIFGPPISEGLDADGRVTLLVTPEVGDRGREGTLGYFTLRDLFKPSDAPDVATLARSNQRFMLYLSAELVARGGRSDVHGTLAHEYQHLINATRKIFGPAEAEAPESVWLDEGLSMYAMHANGFGLGGDAAVLTSHVEGFLAHPERFSLTTWDAGPYGSSYGMAYLFVLYLAEQFGEPALKQLIDGRERGEGNVEALAQANGTTLDQLFRDFAAAVALDAPGSATGFRGVDLRGSSSGVSLRGPAVTPLPPGARLEGPALPFSVRYVWLPPAAQARTFTLDGLAGGWLIPR